MSFQIDNNRRPNTSNQIVRTNNYFGLNGNNSSTTEGTSGDNYNGSGTTTSNPLEGLQFNESTQTYQYYDSETGSYRDVPRISLQNTSPSANGSVDGTVENTLNLQQAVERYFTQNSELIISQILSFGEKTEESRKLYQAKSAVAYTLIGDFKPSDKFEELGGKTPAALLLDLLNGKVLGDNTTVAQQNTEVEQGKKYAQDLIALLKAESGTTISDAPTEAEINNAINALQSKLQNTTKNARHSIVTANPVVKINSRNYTYETLMKAAIDPANELGANQTDFASIEKLFAGRLGSNTALFTQLNVYENNEKLKGISNFANMKLVDLVKSVDESQQNGFKEELNKYVKELINNKQNNWNWEQQLFTSVMQEFQPIKDQLDRVAQGDSSIDTKELEYKLKLLVGKAKILQGSSNLASNLFSLQNNTLSINGIEKGSVSIGSEYNITNKVLDLVAKVESEYTESTSGAANETIGPFFAQLQRDVLGNGKIPVDSATSYQQLAMYRAKNYTVRTVLSSFLTESVLTNGGNNSANGQGRLSSVASLYGVTLKAYDEIYKGYEEGLNSNAKLITDTIKANNTAITDSASKLVATA